MPGAPDTVAAIQGNPFDGGTGRSFDDLLSADGGDIVSDGLALKQIVDLCNDVQRLRAGAA